MVLGLCALTHKGFRGRPRTSLRCWPCYLVCQRPTQITSFSEFKIIQTLLFSSGRYMNYPKFNNLLIRRERTTKFLNRFSKSWIGFSLFSVHRDGRIWEFRRRQKFRCICQWICLNVFSLWANFYERIWSRWLRRLKKKARVMFLYNTFIGFGCDWEVVVYICTDILSTCLHPWPTTSPWVWAGESIQ